MCLPGRWPYYRYAASDLGGPIQPEPTYASETAAATDLVYDNGDAFSGGAASQPDQVSCYYLDCSTRTKIIPACTSSRLADYRTHDLMHTAPDI